MKKLLLIVIIMFMKTSVQAQSAIAYENAYSVYITENLKASKDFYTRWLDFEVVFEATWFVYLQAKDSPAISLAFIDVNHPSTPPAYGAFKKEGSFLTLQVMDAEQVYQKLKTAAAPISYHLKKEDWGQLRFGMTDPNGLYVDIVQQVEPKPGYWDKYMVKDRK